MIGSEAMVAAPMTKSADIIRTASSSSALKVKKALENHIAKAAIKNNNTLPAVRLLLRLANNKMNHTTKAIRVPENKASNIST